MTSKTSSCVVCHAAGLQSIVMNDSFDQRLAAVLAPALEPVLTYISRTPALSGAISNVFNNDSPLVRPQLFLHNLLHSFL